MLRRMMGKGGEGRVAAAVRTAAASRWDGKPLPGAAAGRKGVARIGAALLAIGMSHAIAAADAVRFEPVRDAVVRDSETGLLWTQKDSGYAVDWYKAREFCTRMGAGWRLPGADELASVGEAVRASTPGCKGAACGTASPLRLGNGWLWSDTSEGISDAIGMNLFTGERQSTYRTKRQRALCVGGA